MFNTEEGKFECLFSFWLTPKGFLYLWANGIANFSPILFAFSQIELYRIEKKGMIVWNTEALGKPSKTNSAVFF